MVKKLQNFIRKSFLLDYIRLTYFLVLYGDFAEVARASCRTGVSGSHGIRNEASVCSLEKPDGRELVCFLGAHHDNWVLKRSSCRAVSYLFLLPVAVIDRFPCRYDGRKPVFLPWHSELVD